MIRDSGFIFRATLYITSSIEYSVPSDIIIVRV